MIVIKDEKLFAKRVAKRVVKLATVGQTGEQGIYNKKLRKQMEWKLQQILMDEMDRVKDGVEPNLSLEELRDEELSSHDEVDWDPLWGDKE